MKYKIVYTGRKTGAQGITYAMSEMVDADSKEEAILKLYNHSEHIHIIKIEEV